MQHNTSNGFRVSYSTKQNKCFSKKSTCVTVVYCSIRHIPEAVFLLEKKNLIISNANHKIENLRNVEME